MMTQETPAVKHPLDVDEMRHEIAILSGDPIDVLVAMSSHTGTIDSLVQRQLELLTRLPGDLDGVQNLAALLGHVDALRAAIGTQLRDCVRALRIDREAAAASVDPMRESMGEINGRPAGKPVIQDADWQGGYLVADRLTREPGESDAHWKERVRRFMTGGVLCETCGADLEARAQAEDVTLDPLARYCGPECDPAEQESVTPPSDKPSIRIAVDGEVFVTCGNKEVPAVACDVHCKHKVAGPNISAPWISGEPCTVCAELITAIFGPEGTLGWPDRIAKAYDLNERGLALLFDERAPVTPPSDTPAGPLAGYSPETAELFAAETERCVICSREGTRYGIERGGLTLLVCGTCASSSKAAAQLVDQAADRLLKRQQEL